MSELSQRRCTVCEKGAPLVEDAWIQIHRDQIPDWDVVICDGVNQLEREFGFEDFEKAMAFTQKIGKIAEEEGHHPMLITEWGKVTVVWWTHKIKGLHENDFIMAAKTDEVYSGQA